MSFFFILITLSLFRCCFLFVYSSSSIITHLTRIPNIFKRFSLSHIFLIQYFLISDVRMTGMSMIYTRFYDRRKKSEFNLSADSWPILVIFYSFSLIHHHHRRRRRFVGDELLYRHSLVDECIE